MEILNLYQTAFLATAIGTVMVAARAKRRVSPAQVMETSHEPPPQIAPAAPAQPVSEVIKERIRQLDKLFDDNLLTVDEYVELRRRASSR
jgi:hypothetical protein